MATVLILLVLSVVTAAGALLQDGSSYLLNVIQYAAMVIALCVAVVDRPSPRQ